MEILKAYKQMLNHRLNQVSYNHFWGCLIPEKWVKYTLSGKDATIFVNNILSCDC